MKKQTVNGITKTFSGLTVDSIAANPYKAGLFQAQIRQTVETSYPSKRVDNSMQDSLFNVEAFNLPAGESYTSKRVGWIAVPEGTTPEQVQQLLNTKTNARICKKYANNVLDVLTDEQKYAIANNQQTVEAFAERLLIRDKDGNAIAPAQYSQGFYVNDYTNHKGSKDEGINAFGDIDVRTVKTGETVVTAAQAAESVAKLQKLTESATA